MFNRQRRCVLNTLIFSISHDNRDEEKTSNIKSGAETARIIKMSIDFVMKVQDDILSNFAINRTPTSHTYKYRYKRRGGTGITASKIEQAEEFDGQFTDVFNKSDHSEVPFLSRSALFMDDVVSNEVVTKLLNGLNPSKALGPGELHPRVLKELTTELGPVFAHLF